MVANRLYTWKRKEVGKTKNSELWRAEPRRFDLHSEILIPRCLALRQLLNWLLCCCADHTSRFRAYEEAL